MKHQMVRTTVDIPASLYRKLKAQAAAQGRSVGELILLGARGILAGGKRPHAKRVKFPLIVSDGPKVVLTNEQIYGRTEFPLWTCLDEGALRLRSGGPASNEQNEKILHRGRREHRGHGEREPMVNTRMLAAVWALLGTGLAAGAQTKPVDAEGHAWWQHAVFYEIYPRSFADSNNDGVGDLKGITSKLDYLKELGVNAIWITPCFPSPQVDFGYDVSDYEAIDPMYGTMEDFDKLVAEGKKRDIRVILDFVVNHSSDQHKWFIDSESSKTAAHRDWYIWRDGKGPDKPPNNWLSTFGLSAWKLDLKTGQYYYDYFYAE
jgi:hypothetical protein